MRNNNKTNRQVMFNIAKVMFLVLCFAITFVYAMSVDANADMAFAAGETKITNVGKDDRPFRDTTGDATFAVVGDSGGNLSAIEFGYPYAVSNVGSYTATETFKNTKGGPINFDFNFYSGALIAGETTLYMYDYNGSDKSGEWKFGIDEASAKGDIYGIFNYQISPFVASLLSRSDTTISATVSIKSVVSQKADKTYYRFVSSDHAVKAEDVKGSGTFKSKSYSEGYNNGSGTTLSDTIQLSSNFINIMVGFDWGFVAGSGATREITLSNLQIKFNVTMDNSLTDSADLIINDGSAPVVASQYMSGIADSYLPYLPTTDQNFTANGVTSSWPVWTEYLSSRLSRFTDGVSYGVGKMPSFTSTPLGTINGNNYYKKSVVSYVDTFDYGGNGGFSFVSLKTVYDNAIAQGKTEAQAKNAVVEALKYMSIGTKKISGIDWEKFNKGDYAGAIIFASAEDKRFVSGIKTVQVGDAYRDMDNGTGAGAVFDVYSFSTTQSKTIYVDGVAVGYARVTKTNRAQVQVETFMYTNAKVKTTVTDYGSSSTSTTIDFKGIDTTTPDVSGANATNSGVSLNGDYVFADVPSLWFREQKLVADAGVDTIEDESLSGFSPYIWFYTADRADSIDELKATAALDYANYQAVVSAGLLPIGVGSLNTFEYDFTTGMAKSLSGAFDAIGNSAGRTVTGAGYYRFTFYTFDLAGNKGVGTTSYYVKADYDTPTYTVQLSYKDDSTGIFDTINAENNGKIWATGATTLTLTLTKPGFSGNTIVFEGSNDTYFIVVDGKGEHSGSDYGKLVRYGSAQSVKDASGNTFSLELQNYLQTTTANVSVRKTSKGEITVTFAFTGQETVAFVTEFVAYIGQYNTATAVESDDMAKQYSDNTNWRGGVNVLIDRTAPETPVISDEGGYVFDLDTYDLPSVKQWYTDGYSIDVTVAFSDYIINKDYASGLKLYAGISYISNLADLKTLESKEIEKYYRKINETTFKDYLGENSRLQVLGGDELDSDESFASLDLVQSLNGGMRAVYVWCIDQAGNPSPLDKYYILADGSVYTMHSSVLVNHDLGTTSNISQQNDDGIYSTTFMRGESVNLTLSLAAGYVPYTLDLTSTAGNVRLLENYTPNAKWTLADSNYSEIVKFGSDYSQVSFTVDDPENLGALPSIMTLQFAHRQVITYTLTNTQAAYTSQEAVVPMTLNNALAKSAFNFVYVDGDGHTLYKDKDGNATANPDEAVLDEHEEKVLFVPVKVGDYKVKIYIDKHHASFVTNDFAMDADGNQVVNSITFKIVRGNAYIKAKATSSVYGETIALEYELEGIVEENLAAEGISFMLSLRVAGFDPNYDYNVGEYQIIADGLQSSYANYNVSYVSAYHTVVRKDVRIETLPATKAYGDVDPKYTFGVLASSFGESEIANIFGGYGYTQLENEVIDGNLYYVFDGGDRISRKSGESVGEYAYSAESGLFDINDNYRIIIQNNKYFVIEQRVVVLDVSGQSTLLPYGASVDATSIHPTYAIGNEYASIANEISALTDGKLSLSAESSEVADERYSKVYVYTVLLDTLGNANIRLQLGADTEYQVCIALQSVVVVSIKSDVSIEFCFGTVWDNMSTVVFDVNKFDVNGEIGEYSGITWTATVVGGDGSIPGVGKHRVSVQNAKIIGTDGAETSDAVLVEDFFITINPAVVKVVPTVEKNAKVYGDLDSVYGISYKIAEINGVEIATDSTYAGYTYAQILNEISGAFARARYTSGGIWRANGTRYDDATNENGIILNDTLGSGEYYGYRVLTEFASADSNFVVEAEYDEAFRFIVNKKSLELHSKDFAGVNKSYDSYTNVNFGMDKAYDLSSLLVRATDDVQLAFDASYREAGSITQATQTSILFTHISLVGTHANNYVLTTLVNDGVNTLVNGSHDASANIDGATTVEIYYIDNAVGDASGRITVFIGSIGVRKTDIAIVKEYDNTRVLSIGDIRISRVENGAVGTSILYQIAESGNAVLMSATAFGGVNVGTNYMIDSLSVFFPFESANDVQIVNSGEYADGDVQVRVGEHGGKVGIILELHRMGAVITQRILDAGRFESITAVDRDYNATDVVQVEYRLAPSALATGDTLSNVGLVLMGGIADGNVNAGTHPIVITETRGGSGATEFDNVHTYVANGNYAVDVNSINKAFGLIVNVSRAKLLPNVEFINKVYDNKTDVETVKGEGNDFTTLYYSTNLNAELSKFRIDGEVSYKLSTNGKQDANVTDTLMHNVMVRGLKVVEDGTNNYLQNYEVYGFRYVDGKYVQVGTVPSGTVEDYELLDAVRVDKKSLPIIENNVDIQDKVYDGTRDATINIALSELHVVKEHLDLLSLVATGEFARKQVGVNIQVIIDSVELVAKTEEGLSLLNNYQLESFSARFTSNIIPRPIVIEAGLGEKVYNGNADVAKSSVKYSLEGILPADLSSYAMQTVNGAYYVDGDVEVERDAGGNVIYRNAEGEALEYRDGAYYDGNGNRVIEKYATVLNKEGTVYGPRLANIKENYINYLLTTESNDGTGDYVAYLDKAGTMHYYEKAESADDVAAYYYRLPTTTKYISISNKDAIAEARNAGAIVGYYGNVGSRAYVVKDDYTGSGVLTMDEITYINAIGKITQRAVQIRADGIRKTNNATAFEKEYDATTKFFGTRGENVDSNADYYYIEGSVSSVVGDDDVEIEDVFAEFDSMSTNAMYVVFTASGIRGEDAYKYTVSANATQTRLSAKITKRTINAHLADGEIVYGTNPGTIEGEITYTIGGYDAEWNKNEESFIMNFKEYLVVLGFIASVEDEVKAEDLVYLDDAIKRTGSVVDGAFVPASDGSVGELIRLKGSFTTPKATATFDLSKPNCGDVARTYKIKSANNAENFVFVGAYTGNGTDGTSRLTVVKKDLYIGTDGFAKTKYYAGNDPLIEYNYYNEKGESGIVSGETWINLFKVGSTDYRPVAQLAIYNTSTKTYTEVDRYPKINAHLEENEIYVYVLKAPNSVDYSTLPSLKNYNVILSTQLTHDVVSVDGVDTVVPKYVFEGISYQAQASTLTITLPSFDSVSVKNTQNTYVYAQDAYRQPIDRIRDVVSGLQASDTVKYLTSANVEQHATHAGVYTGIIRVIRPIMIDGGDTNGYTLVWDSPTEITITIERADIELSAKNVYKTYTGAEQRFDAISGGISYKYLSLNSSDFVFTVEQLVDGSYVSATLLNAGDYRISVATKSDFETKYPDFTSKAITVKYVIKKAVANVNIDTEGFEVGAEGTNVIKLSAEYDAEFDYDLPFSVAMAENTGVQLTVADLELVYSSEVTQAGRYNFVIRLKDDSAYDSKNFTLNGAVGVLELSQYSVSDGKSSIVNNNGMVANKLVVRAIDETSVLAGDIAYVEIVKAYMPNITEEEGMKRNAKLSSIVRTDIYCDDKLVVFDGQEVQMNIAIPQNVDVDNMLVYTVTKDGKLKKLTNYSVSNGNLQYTTDYISAIVFVEAEKNTVEPWVIYTAVGISLFVLLVLILTIVGVIVRKSKLKKL